MLQSYFYSVHPLFVFPLNKPVTSIANKTPACVHLCLHANPGLHDTRATYAADSRADSPLGMNRCQDVCGHMHGKARLLCWRRCGALRAGHWHGSVSEEGCKD